MMTQSCRPPMAAVPWASLEAAALPPCCPAEPGAAVPAARPCTAAHGPAAARRGAGAAGGARAQRARHRLWRAVARRPALPALGRRLCRLAGCGGLAPSELYFVCSLPTRLVFLLAACSSSPITRTTPNCQPFREAPICNRRAPPRSGTCGGVLRGLLCCSQAMSLRSRCSRQSGEETSQSLGRRAGGALGPLGRGRSHGVAAAPSPRGSPPPRTPPSFGTPYQTSVRLSAPFFSP